MKTETLRTTDGREVVVHIAETPEERAFLEKQSRPAGGIGQTSDMARADEAIEDTFVGDPEDETIVIGR